LFSQTHRYTSHSANLDERHEPIIPRPDRSTRSTPCRLCWPYRFDQRHFARPSINALLNVVGRSANTCLTVHECNWTLRLCLQWHGKEIRPGHCPPVTCQLLDEPHLARRGVDPIIQHTTAPGGADGRNLLRVVLVSARHDGLDQPIGPAPTISILISDAFAGLMPVLLAAWRTPCPLRSATRTFSIRPAVIGGRPRRVPRPFDRIWPARIASARYRRRASTSRSAAAGSPLVSTVPASSG
jgi:hypothetical protein